MIFILLFLGMAFYNAYIFLALAPRLDSFLSSREMSEEISAYIQDGYTVGIHGGRRGLFSFYANAKITEISVDNLQEFLEKSPQHLLVLKAEDIQRFQKNNELSMNLNTVYSRNVANITYNMVRLNE